MWDSPLELSNEFLCQFLLDRRVLGKQIPNPSEGDGSGFMGG